MTPRTPFAMRLLLAAIDRLYHALERLGDLVAGLGARLTKGHA